MKQILRTFVCLILPIISMAESHAYVPLVREGVEWGCVKRIPRYKEEPGYYENQFFRLQFRGKTEINGKEYSNLYYYSSNVLDEASMTPVAWYRDDDKKVYSILNEDQHKLPYEFLYVYTDFDHEFLLFDFSMEVGDKRYSQYTEEYYLECIEVGNIETKEEFRKSMKFMFNGFGGSDYDALFTEGMGPVVDYGFANTTLLFPYTNTTTSWPPRDTLGMLLYERKVRDDGYQGEIVYESPLFGEFAPYDKSVTEWERHPGADSLESINASNVRIESRGGEIIASCADAEISGFELHAIDGSLISQASATGTEVRLSAPSKGFAILTITLSNGTTHTTKLHIK